MPRNVKKGDFLTDDTYPEDDPRGRLLRCRPKFEPGAFHLPKGFS